MYGRKRNGITSNSHLQYSEDEHDELLHTGSPIVMLIIHNLDHMMQPHEWETLLTREIHGARMLGVAVVRESSSSRPWGEGELTAYIFTRHDAPLIRQYLHNRRLGFRRLHVDTVTSENGIEAFLVHKILQLLKLNPQMSEVTMEQRINSFFRRIPSSIRPQDYDRTAVMHSIHQCMGLPASPPASSEESEADSDSPPLHRKPMAQPMQQKLPIQMPIEQSNTYFTPQIIRIDEYTMQLHFTPLYFELLDSMPIPPPTDERDQWIANANF
ncbi:unnamed protein product [Rotaria socialis]|uniref:Uncharacterized protein n=1 Tax=Rotaria socialis TaxID=392032 RepID=A0A817X0G8_9BILA|nr:unnamed protein product [Rotaria socialis]CAF3507788.1 unnamed protein product [Rotaria socialis]CAF4289065.1 unnamed protein product [Rotaria socialis]CAF4694056.1 unnamed protein product [Rotaria socialis]